MTAQSEYEKKLNDRIRRNRKNTAFMQGFESRKPEITQIVSLNLDPVMPLLNSLYCPIPYSEHRPPDRMLRSLLLMTALKKHSITEWTDETRSSPALAAVAGFDPADTPGVGTYYDFINRCMNGTYRKPSGEYVPRSRECAAGHLRSPEDEKQAKKDAKKEILTQYSSQSEKLAEELLSETDQPRPEGFEKRLEDLFVLLGLMPTLQAGLISDPGRLTVCGDGSIAETAASPHGKPACDCRKNGIRKCGCPGLYTSPTAKWCYDAAHDVWTYGDRYYHIAVTQNGRDFPLIVIMPGGNESDYTLSLKAADRLLKIFREHSLNAGLDIFCGDGHHDTHAHYDYFQEKGVRPVIPLPEKSKTGKAVFPQVTGMPDIRFDPDGRPLCPGGCVMRRHEYSKRKRIHVFACPAKRPTHRKGKYVYVYDAGKCPNGRPCSPESTIGPCVYVRSAADPRMFPAIPRDSRLYREVSKQRSCAERLNSVLDSFKTDGAHRHPDRTLFRLTLANIVIHAGIRYKEAVRKSSEEELFKITLTAAFGTDMNKKIDSG